MKKFILFGQMPPNHHIGICIEAKGTFIGSCVFGIQMIMAGLLMPLSYILKIPVYLDVKPIGYRKPKLFFTYKLWRLRRRYKKAFPEIKSTYKEKP